MPSIGVCHTVTTTYAQGVELVAIAVAVTSRDVRTSALVNLSGPLQIPQASSANAVVTSSQMPSIGVRSAVTTTHAQGVELVAVAVAVAGGDVRTSAP